MRALALVAVSTLRAPSRRLVVDMRTTSRPSRRRSRARINMKATRSSTRIMRTRIRLPMMHEWTAETFDADLEAGGHAEWDIPAEAFVFLRTVADPSLTSEKARGPFGLGARVPSQSR